MNHKLKILHTEWSQGWGGQEIRILTEALCLRKLGHEVFLAIHPNAQLLQKARENNLEYFPVKYHKGIALSALLKLLLIIKRKNIDIIHSHSSVDARIGGLAGIITGISVIRSRHLSTPISNRFLSRILYMKLADHVITSGESIRQRMINNNHMNPDKITSIPAGADEAVFYPREPNATLRQELGLDSGHFIVGMVAVLRSWKGHDSLFHAIKKYKEINPKVRLLVLGDGPRRKHLEELKNALGLQHEILMLGHINNPEEYYSIMDAVILNSYANEATSQTLPQAMLMKIPVIGTNIGSIPEVIIHRKTGLLIEPNDLKQKLTLIMTFAI
jgi:glycosyltransferase involved in cell wall biosynthesis